MDYLEMLTAVPGHRTALIEDGRRYTYEDLVQNALHMKQTHGGCPPIQSGSLVFIKESTVYRQLVSFLAHSGTGCVPVLMPPDAKSLPIISPDMQVPSGACMGVLTSGTTGTPRIWFRTFDSWHSFFPVQNRIFGIDGSTCMFVHGCLAFTGNLNMYLALLSVGASIITSTPVHPPEWNRVIMHNRANAVYLIPSKLRLLAKTATASAECVKTILSGSQSLGADDVLQLKAAYPRSHTILYYGASELSYVSYIRDSDMGGNPACVGTPFPGISITLRDGSIMVDTPYRALGVQNPAGAGDMGYLDQRGYLCLLGRRDNVYNIHGRQIPALLVENALLALDGVDEAAVVLEGGTLTAYVVPSPDYTVSHGRTLPQVLMAGLAQSLESYQLPRRIICRETLPKNSSGKPVPGRLSAAT